MMDVIYPSGPNGLIAFLIITLVLGGAAAWATGRAIALTWRPLPHLVLYIALLTFAVRFFHYALAREPFLTVGNVLIDFLVLMAMALIGYRAVRAWQMQAQYPWLFERAGPISWRRRGEDRRAGR